MAYTFGFLGTGHMGSALAEAACAETKGVDLYTAETLAAYGRERAKILPEDLHYS